MNEDSVWLVQRWEVPLVLANCPSAVYAAPPPVPPPPSLRERLLRRDKPQPDALEQYAVMLRWRMAAQVMRGALAALSFCHSRAVVHRALSSSAILLSSYQLEAAAQGQVRFKRTIKTS
jgi:hypothetical protein